jgi:cytochrome c peroxidase
MLRSVMSQRSIACALALSALWTIAACESDEGQSPTLEASVPKSDGHTHAPGDGAHSHDDAGVDGADAARYDGSLGAPDGSLSDGFAWDLPKSFPRPPVPVDNPMSAAKVELGRHLFYDPRLSGNGTQSCASCHKQALAFADERAVGLGTTGESHSRGSMSLANVAYAQTLTWSQPNMTELERQLHVPLFGDRPIELGAGSIAQLEERLRAVPRYDELFAAAFADELQPITMLNVARALASFQRTLISGNSPFDRYYYGGEQDALSESAKRGLRFVTTEEDHRFECSHCHGKLPFFSDHIRVEGDAPDAPKAFHNTGLYDEDGLGSYPAPNVGTVEVTLNPSDRGKFKAPTLRNVALTAPYMHDGSIATLSEVIDHYAAGGRKRNRRQTDAFVNPFTITESERADIIAFLESLTDQTFLTNPKFADPWPQQ